MNLSSETQSIYSQIDTESPKFGDLKKLAKEIKTDHSMAMELWNTGEYFPRLLAVLIMDKKLLTQELINTLDKEMQKHSSEEKNRLMEWLMANQLMKAKSTIALMNSWVNSSSVLQRRTYWYYQARLRWTGQTPTENTPELLSKIEADIAEEDPDVQWAMNYTAAWIGVFDEQYRNRCKSIGEKTGLYKDEIVPRNCTPSYLPLFIEIEVDKRK